MRVLLAGAFLLAGLATTATAQQGVDVSGPHPLATRAQLESSSRRCRRMKRTAPWPT